MSSSNLLNTIASTDPTFKDDLQEEQDILKKVIIDEKNGVENLANEQNLLIVAKENVDTIVDALKTNSNVQLALQDDVNNKLKMYGGIEGVLSRLNNPDLTKIPRCIKKMMRENLPKVILYFKKKNQDLANILETLLEKIKDDLIKTKPKKIIRETFEQLKSRKWFGGRQLNKTKKYIKGGDDGDIYMFIFGWIGLLIFCCSFVLPCAICGPLLVLTVCFGIGGDVCSSFASFGNFIFKKDKDKKEENQKGGKKKNKKTNRNKRTKRNYK